MFRVYKFRVTLSQLGFIVSEGEDPVLALRAAWEGCGRGFNVADVHAHATLVKEFEETDEGWEQALDLLEELEEYAETGA